MKERLASLLRPAVCLAALLAVGAATPALGHEARAMAGFRFVVGWGQEPAHTGFKNSVDVTVSEADGGAPVTDLGDSLRVEVSKGPDKTTLALEANSGAPGEYRAWLIPTRPGTYTLRLTGSVRGQPVDQSFTSSPTTFNDVENAATIQFPAKDPSTGELATRIDREFPRVDVRTEMMEARLRDAGERVDSARMLAIAGVLAGALGLVTAALALIAVGRGSRLGRGPKIGESRARAEQAGSLSR